VEDEVEDWPSALVSRSEFESESINERMWWLAKSILPIAISHLSDRLMAARYSRIGTSMRAIAVAVAQQHRSSEMSIGMVRMY
jgi:hypothetical protein